jgi:hypothetical protein
MKSGSLVLLLCLAPGVAQTLGQSLPDIARQQGGSATTLIDVDVPVAHPPELMRHSDLVIHGRVVNVTTRLSSDDSDVVTEYTITPIQAFKARRGMSAETPGIVPTVVVERPGGRLLTGEGLRLSTSINLFPESECFTVGEEVVAFLTYQSDARRYRFTSGEFGAYRLKNGMVSPMTRNAAASLRAQPIEASLFFADLQKPR